MVVGSRRRTAPAGSPPSAADGRRDRAAVARRSTPGADAASRRRSTVRADAGRPPSGATRSPPRPTRIRRRRARQGRAGPRGGGRRPTRRSRSAAVLAPAPHRATRTASCLLQSTASSAPAPSCWSAATATSCGPTRWPAPPPARGDPEADARLAAALLGSATYRHEHQVTIDMVHDTLLALLLVRRLRARAVGRRAGQRAAPRHPGRGPAVAPAGVGARAGAGAAPHPGGVRPARATRRWRSSPSSRASTAAATPAPSAGSTPPATASGRSASAAPSIDGADGPGLRRQRHRRRLRPRHRAGRDPGQAPGHARRPRPAVHCDLRLQVGFATLLVQCSLRRHVPQARGGVRGRRRRRRGARRGRRRWRRGRCGRTTSSGAGGGRAPSRTAGPTSADSLGRVTRSPWAAASAPRSTPWGVPKSCSKRSARQLRACGRNEKMPPPSLSTTTMVRSSRPAGRARGGRWCRAGRRRRRPARRVGASECERHADRGGHARRRCRWRPGWRAPTRRARGAPYHSRSRTGIDDADDQRGRRRAARRASVRATPGSVGSAWAASTLVDGLLRRPPRPRCHAVEPRRLGRR